MVRRSRKGGLYLLLLYLVYGTEIPHHPACLSTSKEALAKFRTGCTKLNRECSKRNRVAYLSYGFVVVRDFKPDLLTTKYVPKSNSTEPHHHVLFTHGEMNNR